MYMCTLTFLTFRSRWVRLLGGVCADSIATLAEFSRWLRLSRRVCATFFMLHSFTVELLSLMRGVH